MNISNTNHSHIIIIFIRVLMPYIIMVIAITWVASCEFKLFKSPTSSKSRPMSICITKGDSEAYIAGEE